MRKKNNLRKNKIKSNKGSVSLLVGVTILTFMAILTGTYLTVMILRESQYESNIRIQQVYLKDVNIVDDIYVEVEEAMNAKPVAIPEKSIEESFDRTYGVIEVEFLSGTGYEIAEEANEPKMTSDMKKVYWEDDGTEVLEGDDAFDETKWYSYTAQTGDTEDGGTSKWANAVTLDSDGNIEAYWVWIPRYAYRIVYFDTQAHEDAYRTSGTTDGIVGYSDARGLVHLDGTTPSDMESPVTSRAVGEDMLRPHPAFEDGSKTGYTQGEWSEKLEGIWIAKYETSGSLEEMKVLPGESALVSQTIGDMYSNALNFSSVNKSHMMKNSEWGAMAYLTESKYGRNGTAVVQNSQNTYTAGASGATVASNPLQSTTGNYYGIYDTVGGAIEYVSGYIADGTNSYGNSFASINIEAEDSTNNKTKSTEYATVYGMLSVEASIAENYNLSINKKFGDAIIETSISGAEATAWDLARSYFVGVNNSSNSSFFVRGGTCYSSDAGLTYFSSGNGSAGNLRGFRLSILVK